jgi:hypothetical protein
MRLNQDYFFKNQKQMDILPLKNLVFAGGGVRGIAYSGALMAFEDTYKIKVNQHFMSFAGSSVGSLYALVSILDLDVSIVPKILSTYGLSDIFMKDPTCLLTHYALNTGESLKNVVAHLLNLGSCTAETTFKELFVKTGKKLIVVTVDINSARTLYLDHTNDGTDMPVIRAIMGSMALPPLFPAVVWKTMLLADGGLAENFALSIFPPSETMGLKTSWYIMPGNPMSDIASYYTRILAILQMPMHSIQSMGEEDYQIIEIDLGCVKPDNADVDVQSLIFKGYRAAIGAFTKTIPTLNGDPTRFLER